MAEISSCINSSSSPQRLQGKVALVTGGATGIGETIVRVFYKHGAKVCLVDINDEAGQNVCESLGVANPNVCYFHCDVSKEDDVKQAVDFTVQKFGTLDIMVNNAGVNSVANPLGVNTPPGTDICNVEGSEFDKLLDVNVKGTFYGMKHSARIMIPSKKGSIISLCSIAAVVAGLGAHSYAASKHAILGLTKNVAAELGQHGIRVNCVSPYAVLTNMALAHVPEGDRTNDVVAGFRSYFKAKANLQGVELTAEDVANTVLFLASDEARYISGHNLVVDGGFASVNHSLGTFK